MQEIWVWSLGQEDSLEEGMANHSSTLAWRIPWAEEPGRLQSIGSRREGYNWCDHAAAAWNLERWCWWTYLQGSNRDADIENRFVDTVREGEGCTNWKINIETYTSPHVKQRANGKFLNMKNRELNLMLVTTWGEGHGMGCGREVKDRGNICSPWLIYFVVWQNQRTIVKRSSSN